MRQSTADAARDSGMHPANFVLQLSGQCSSLDALWPDVDEVGSELLQILQEEDQATVDGGEISDELTAQSARVLDRLKKHKHWKRSKAVCWRRLHREYCPNSVALKRVVDGLVDRGLVGTLDDNGDIYWLIKERKEEIEKLLKTWALQKETQRKAQSGHPSASSHTEYKIKHLRDQLVKPGKA